MDRFVGRERELSLLTADLERIRAEGRGRFILVRGRRRVGKSRLIEEFVRGVAAPHLFFSASRHSAPAGELAAFADLFTKAQLLPVGDVPWSFGSWAQAFGMIETAARSSGQATIVVLDELPYILEGDASVEGLLATSWDRLLSRAPVMLIVIGSDLAMMEALTTYGRPLHGRPTREMVVRPLNPAEVASLIDTDPATALDAYTVIGGFPQLGLSWGHHRSVGAFVRHQVDDPTSPLIVNAERALAAEFPPDAQARAVLSAIGSGERSFTDIGRVAGVPRQSLERAIDLLIVKGAIAREEPVPAIGGGRPRYTIADPSIRFWLRFIEPGLAEIERDRSDLAWTRFEDGWQSFRGKAVEPILREALLRAAEGKGTLGSMAATGAYWTRKGDLEVDITATRSDRTLIAIGSIKWRERAPFGRRDRRRLEEMRPMVPGAGIDTTLIGVSRSGFTDSGLDVELGPEEILAAYRNARTQSARTSHPGAAAGSGS